jgi:hypothetical protein
MTRIRRIPDAAASSKGPVPSSRAIVNDNELGFWNEREDELLHLIDCGDDRASPRCRRA